MTETTGNPNFDAASSNSPDADAVESAKVLAKMLRTDFEHILTNSLGLMPARLGWASSRTMADVARQSIQSMKDYRHRYPFAVSPLKYISVITFWIVKLKPINVMAFKRNGRWVESTNLNERVAYIWMRDKILQAAQSGDLKGFLASDESIVLAIENMFETIENETLYEEGDSDSVDPDDNRLRNNKQYETLYYLRFKKITAINIYESILHLLLPIKAFSAPR
ncbi:hypothetical protein [Maricaulis alexandrii]|uniref:hypothetical protein n=1 Tax=Maricaulis alexandrii TaxID=2570354 RepID=UPI0011081964|nr:hypothetical protein [Maricaulis alexandrii]